MNKALARSMAGLAGATLAIGALGSAPAQAATAITIRPADLVAPSDTAGGATMQFTSDGVYLKNDDAANGYARAHFKVGVPLADVHAVNYTWYGTDFAPGVYYDIDLDGDGKLDGQFIGENSYGGKDVWLNRDAEDFNSTTTVAGYFAAHAPCDGNTARTGNVDGCGASGAQYHGTLDDWTRSLKAAGKTPVIYSGGFGLSGGAGAGVIRQITYGPNTYTFTSDPVVTPPVSKSASSVTVLAKDNKVKSKHKIKLVGDVTPVGSGATATLQEFDNGAWVDAGEPKIALPSSGDFKFVTKAPKKGAVQLRVVVSETSTTLGATSDPVTVKVLKPKKRHRK